ncbi:MAG: HAD family hydrolase [Anaeroplasmataceae bacterium]|nr:HAD family hydrolase [Anaeroplasmataceae bacterium]
MKAILFDLYGTLIDIRTNEEDERLWKKISKKVKTIQHFSPEKLREQYKTLCKEKEQIIEEIEILEVFEALFSVSKDDALKIAWKFRRASTIHIHLYKGVKKLLKKLRDEGYSLYVLSNAQEAFTLPELERLGIKNYFNGIAISSAYGVKKPNVKFFSEAIKNFSLSGEIWMIGNDAICDIHPAKQLGLRAIFVESNLTPENQEEDKVVGFNYQKIYKIISGY